MPTLVFERTGFSVEMPEGGSVADLCDDHIVAGVPFACRHANCGTCRIEVTEGLEHCEGRTLEETRLAAAFNDPPKVRLACQLEIRPGPGVVRLRVVL